MAGSEDRPTGASRLAFRGHEPIWAAACALAAGLLHVALIAPHYFVGSFDDDASYILSAKALLAGQGLTGHMTGGAVVAGAYPPGFPALLAPLLWLWPHTFVPLRLLSVACYAAIFPLTWVYLRRRGTRPWVSVAVLWLLALGPPLATFGSMVMAEAPMLVLFLVWLFLIDRWDRQGGTFTGTGLAVVLAAGALVWMKEAALGMVAGLVVWELLSRRGRTRLAERVVRASSVAAGTAALLVPVIVARISAGVPIAGSRYSQELGGYYQGGLGSRLVHVVPHGLWQMLSTAIQTTLVPYLSPLPTSGHMPDLWKALAWHVSVFVAVGAVVWFRRHRDAAIAIVPIYLAETLLWPFVNERRVILVVPVVAAWYVIGAHALWSALSAWVRSNRPGAARKARTSAVVLTAAVVVVPLLLQAPRDYLYNDGQSGSHFGGSRYSAILSRIGPPSVPVETDYLYSTALFSGHRTARAAFDATLIGCYLPGVIGAIASDSAGFLLLGDVNKPGVMDSPCLLSLANTQPWAVRLLHTTRDDASVYELIGPGTAHPGLTDLTASGRFARSSEPGSVTYEWYWNSRVPVTQVSAGEAAFAGPARDTSSVDLQLEVEPGVWKTFARSDTAVGDLSGSAPFLLATLRGVRASGVRVVLHGSGGSASVADVRALGLVSTG